MADETTAALQTGDTQQGDTTSTGNEAATGATATAAAATGTQQATGTAATGATGTGEAAKPTWPEDWRKQMVGEDEKELRQAERYATPKDIWKKARELERRVSSGELKAPLPDNPTPEQLTAYRAERGIPEKPEGYLEQLPNGLVIGETDKPIFESFVKELHAVNADPKVAHAAVAWYNKFQEDQAAKTAEADVAHREEVGDALRAEWGADYRANVNHVKAFLEAAPKGVADLIANARDAEGRALLNSPQVLQWLASTARELNPIHTIVPGTSGNDGATVDGEIEKIEKVMRDKPKEYFRDEKMQARLRELYGARERIKGRAA